MKYKSQYLCYQIITWITLGILSIFKIIPFWIMIIIILEWGLIELRVPSQENIIEKIKRDNKK